MPSCNKQTCPIEKFSRSNVTFPVPICKYHVNGQCKNFEGSQDSKKGMKISIDGETKQIKLDTSDPAKWKALCEKQDDLLRQAKIARANKDMRKFERLMDEAADLTFKIAEVE